jgi:hypothetical protein
VVDNESERLINEMKAIRVHGAAAVQELSHDVTRLTDWREHVRAKPIPFMFAAAAVGYMLVPARRTKLVSGPPAAVTFKSDDLPKPAEKIASQPITNKVRAAAWAYATRWAQNFVTELVKDQIRNVVEQPDDRVKRTERPHTFRIRP